MSAEPPCIICRRPEVEHRDRNGHGFIATAAPPASDQSEACVVCGHASGTAQPGLCPSHEYDDGPRTAPARTDETLPGVLRSLGMIPTHADLWDEADWDEAARLIAETGEITDRIATIRAEREGALVIPAAAKLKVGEMVRYLGPGSWELVEPECPTPGCSGDPNYPAPGRSHNADCAHPAVRADSEGGEGLVALIEAARHPYKGPNDTDASMLRHAAKRLDDGFDAGGSNTQQTVARVCRVVADLLDNPPTIRADAEQGRTHEQNRINELWRLRGFEQAVVICRERHGPDAEQAAARALDEAEREWRDGWAGWLEGWSGAVCPESPSIEAVVAWLRSERTPFGVYENTDAERAEGLS